LFQHYYSASPFFFSAFFFVLSAALLLMVLLFTPQMGWLAGPAVSQPIKPEDKNLRFELLFI
jgi:hypothetical protein